MRFCSYLTHRFLFLSNRFKNASSELASLVTVTASSTFCLSKKISSRLKTRDSNFRQHSVRHSVSCLPFDDGSVFVTLYEVFSAAGTGRSQCLILGDSSCVAGLPRVLLRSLSLRVLVLDVTGSGEDAEHRPVPRRAHGALCVCPAREPARWQRRAAAPPGAPLKAAPLSALSGRFLVQGESVRSPHVLVQRWVLGARPADRCAPARASFCPLICLPKPEGASTCFRQKPRLPPRAGSLDFCSLFTPKDGRIRRCGEQKCRLC